MHAEPLGLRGAQVGNLCCTLYLHYPCLFHLITVLIATIANYPDRLGPSDKSVENSTEITGFETAGYRIKYSTVLWLLELQIRRGRMV